MPDLEEAATETRKERDAKKPKPQRDAAREAVETVVFVVVLVLLLKLFVTEAFVIPTGSMAETLYGYNKMVTCPKCGCEFPVNSHDEVEGNQVTGRKTPLYGFTCPNCRYMGHINELKPIPDNHSGDRVLVLKPLYNIESPRRGDVVVFKFPEKPQEKQTASNYIKRAQGFGGETVAIFRGKLYVTNALKYPVGDPRFPRPSDPLKLWEPEFMYSTVSNPDANPEGMKFFMDSREKGFPPSSNGFGMGGFEIVRKGERQLLADRRIVWDNDKQPKELSGIVPPRWFVVDGKESWKLNDMHQPQAFSHEAADLHWIRYHHLAMKWRSDPTDKYDLAARTPESELREQKPTKIDNFLGYNAGRDIDPVTGLISERSNRDFDERWVGDLILECDVELPESGAEVVMELSKGVNRFQAVFGKGNVSLHRVGPGNFNSPSRPCKVTTGKCRVRFANVDSKLWVWVDGRCIDFGDESNYQPASPGQEENAEPDGWTKENDVEAPASIGLKGKGIISHITLHRDIYYTRSAGDSTPADLFYVQPGHFLCLGDNSAQSSDSRKWGTVPERLMLGKAVFVFYPIRGRMGFIH
jgi:signal peptidase I